MTSKHPLTLAAALAVLCCGALHAADESDQQIEAAAKDSYVFRNYLKHDSVRIKSDDGNVTLKGTVENEAHKTLAAETAAGLSGVKEVDNQLQVKGEPSKSSDAWITAKVKTALLMHKNVSAKNTKVSTKDGVVTLRGEADSADQKDMTTEFAREVDGVRDAVNNMKVVGAPKRSERAQHQGGDRRRRRDHRRDRPDRGREVPGEQDRLRRPRRAEGRQPDDGQPLARPAAAAGAPRASGGGRLPVGAAGFTTSR